MATKPKRSKRIRRVKSVGAGPPTSPERAPARDGGRGQRIWRCGGCGAVFYRFPPSFPICPRCGKDRVEEEIV